MEKVEGSNNEAEDEMKPADAKKGLGKIKRSKINLDNAAVKSMAAAESNRSPGLTSSSSAPPATKTDHIKGSFGVQKGEIYLDNAATTPLDPRVLHVLTEELHQVGNPSSLHLAGERKKAKLGQLFAHIFCIFCILNLS